MAIIFAFSNQAYSGRITETYLGAANVPVRKLGHVTEFAILALLYLKTLSSYLGGKLAQNKPFRGQIILHALALALAVAYAALDEWHQAFVPGRSSSFSDVLVDTTGMVIALGLSLFLTFRRRKKGPSVQSP